MPEMLNDFTAVIANTTKCLAASTLILGKYIAIILVPLYLIYLLLN